MELEPIQTLTTDSGLLLHLFNESKMVADYAEASERIGMDAGQAQGKDVWHVALTGRMKIEITEKIFAGVDAPALEEVVRVVGPELIYKKTLEKALVRSAQKDEVFEETLQRFLKDYAPYIMRADFPARFVLAVYSEKADPRPYAKKSIFGQ